MQAPEVIERVRPREYFEYPRQRPFNPEGSASPGRPPTLTFQNPIADSLYASVT